MKIRNNKNTIVCLAVFFVFSICMMSSCKDDKIVDQEQFVELDMNGDGVEQLNFESDGGIQEVRLKSDEYWTVECASPWCMVSPANGKAGTICEIQVDSTSNYEPRETKIFFRSGGITKEIMISQKTYGEVLVLSDSLTSTLPEYEDIEKAYFTMTVKANIPFTVTSSEQWITPQKFTYTESVIPRDYKIKFQYDPSFVPADRSATVSLKSVLGNKSVKYVIKQNAAPKIEDNRRGDSLALIGFARGIRSYVPWDHSKSLLHWTGVTLGEEYIRDKNGVILKTKSGKDSMDIRVIGLDMMMFDTKNSLPAEIKYLTHLKRLSLIGNINGFMKRIKLGPEIASLDSLRILNLTGYGISELDPAIGEMKSLEILSLGERLLEVPQDIVESLYKKKLRHLSLTGSRRFNSSDLSQFANVLDTVGIAQTLDNDLLWLFRLEDMRTISLSYNCIRGQIPTQAQIYPDDPTKPVLPRCRSLHLNLNFLTGDVPEWMLSHKHICAWDPYTLVFQQEAKNELGKRCGFDNEPPTEDLRCEDYDWGQPEEDYFPWEQQERLGVSFDQYVKGYRKYF